jgi:hypothetical protein
MNPAIRNSIILAVILLCLIFYFVHSNKSLTTQIEYIETTYTKALSELTKYEGIDPDTLRLSYLIAQIDFLEDWIEQNSKFYLREDNSKISWNYTQDIIRRFNAAFQYNFTSMTRSTGDEYVITGSSRVGDLYSFIHYMEGLGALYTIENMHLNPSLTPTEHGIVNEVFFSITIKPWVDRTIGKNVAEVPLRHITISPLPADPFRAWIYEPIVDPTQERLINPADLTFVSFTGDSAFFLDPSGQIVTLRPNQAVAYGHFSHIDRSNRAVFRINRTGIYDTVYKNLEKGS